MTAKRVETLAEGVVLYLGDCLAALDTMAENSVDSVVCDPPYHLTSIVKRSGKEGSAPAKDYSGEKDGATGAYARASRGFMGKEWDGGDIAFRPETWAKVLRVLKPGGHMFAFSGTRTYHKMATAIEDAGFEIREMHAWVFGSGFPKSHDISKAIDRMYGAEREVVGSYSGATNVANAGSGLRHDCYGINGDKKEDTTVYVTKPATDAARQWDGWGTATKPAMEPICLARKPLSEKTVATNVLKWGTGALNIDATRIEANGEKTGGNGYWGMQDKKGWNKNSIPYKSDSFQRTDIGRWPANLCHDGSEEVLAGFPDVKTGVCPANASGTNSVYGKISARSGSEKSVNGGDNGSAARFFYTAKADSTDRAFSKHPTVKPVSLMRWLVRMVTPPGGTVLDCFAGTGTTGQAAMEEGFKAILIEREEEYQADIRRRISLVFAGEIERGKHVEQDRVESLPLFSEAAE